MTGAARGVGQARAVALAEAGADVVGVDIAAPVSPILEFAPATAEDLNETARQVRAHGARRLAHAADQPDVNQVRAVAERVQREWGGVDVLFANAGIQAIKPLLAVQVADWRDQIDVGTARPHEVPRA